MGRDSGRRGVPVGALVLIALGTLFLLQTLNVVPWDVWGSIWRFWPVFLIAIGVNLLFGRRSPLIAGLLIVGLLGGAITLAALNVGGSGFGFSFGGEHTERFSDSLSEATRLDLNADFGAGTLTIDALPAGAPLLWEGELVLPGSIEVTPDLSRTGDRATLRFDVSVDGFPFIRGDHRWDILVSRDVALALDIDGGAANVDLDLEQLHITELSVDVGAADVDIALPSVEGTMRVDINAGAANITIDIPSDAAARIRSDGALSNLDIDGRFQHSGSYRVSDDWDTATNRIDIEIDTGVSNVRVK